jgi:hypothetical protein
MTQDHTTARLDAHERAIDNLQRGQDAIFRKLEDLNGSVTAVANSLIELKAQRGPAFRDLLDVGTRLVTIIGAVVVGIVYLARNGQSPEAHAVDNRIAKLEWQHACLLEPSSCLPRGYAWSRPIAAQ